MGAAAECLFHKSSWSFGKYTGTPWDHSVQICLRRRAIAYTPAHGSWLSMAAPKICVLSRQVRDQLFTTAEQVRHVVTQ